MRRRALLPALQQPATTCDAPTRVDMQVVVNSKVELTCARPRHWTKKEAISTPGPGEADDPLICSIHSKCTPTIIPYARERGRSKKGRSILSVMYFKSSTEHLAVECNKSDGARRGP